MAAKIIGQKLTNEYIFQLISYQEKLTWMSLAQQILGIGDWWLRMDVAQLDVFGEFFFSKNLTTIENFFIIVLWKGKKYLKSGQLLKNF